MTTDGNGARPYLKVSTSVLTGVAQTVRALDCPLSAVTRLSSGGGALPVITAYCVCPSSVLEKPTTTVTTTSGYKIKKKAKMMLSRPRPKTPSHPENTVSVQGPTHPQLSVWWATQLWGATANAYVVRAS